MAGGVGCCWSLENRGKRGVVAVVDGGSWWWFETETRDTVMER